MSKHIIHKLEQERNQFKKERDTLIKDIEKLRTENQELKTFQDFIVKGFDKLISDSINYDKLTEHILIKAKANPSIHRYQDLAKLVRKLDAKNER